MLAFVDRMRFGPPRTNLELQWIKRAGWLGRNLPARVPRAPHKEDIERAARQTAELGPQALAKEYGQPGATRTPSQVRSTRLQGDVYAWLVRKRKPGVVVEFGAAFGVSGMYFGAALEAARRGHLYSFEVNPEWAEVAEHNIRTVTERFTLTRGAMEETVDSVVPGLIDLVLVDGIHTYDFVLRQMDVLRPRLAPRAVVILDDINFRKNRTRMRDAWLEVAGRPDVVAAVEVNRRMGVAQFSSAGRATAS